MVENLILIANDLDSRGLTKEADRLDLIIKKAEALDWFQIGLAGLGLIPGTGEAADGVNAGISALRSDPIGMTLSTISMIPTIGDSIGKSTWAIVEASKFAGMSMTLSSTAKEIMKLVNQNSNTIDTTLKKADEIIGRFSKQGAAMYSVWHQDIMPILENVSRQSSGVVS